MPISRLESGKDFRKCSKQVRIILDQIADWIEKREHVKITPSQGVGQMRADGSIDLSDINTRVSDLEKG